MLEIQAAYCAFWAAEAVKDDTLWRSLFLQSQQIDLLQPRQRILRYHLARQENGDPLLHSAGHLERLPYVPSTRDFGRVDNDYQPEHLTKNEFDHCIGKICRGSPSFVKPNLLAYIKNHPEAVADLLIRGFPQAVATIFWAQSENSDGVLRRGVVREAMKPNANARTRHEVDCEAQLVVYLRVRRHHESLPKGDADFASRSKSQMKIISLMSRRLPSNIPRLVCPRKLRISDLGAHSSGERANTAAHPLQTLSLAQL